jgi:hypothetical protein
LKQYWTPPPEENKSDPDVEQPSASSLPFQFTPVPPLVVLQLPKVALPLNPPPDIKLLLDCWVQHLPFVQDWPFPVLQALAQAPQFAESLLVFVQTPLQVVPEQEQVLLGALPVQV